MELWLPRNLESILAANCDAIEVLVLDNSSTDNSGYLADMYAKKYPQFFTVIHKENRGYGSSVNWAIKKANGQYLRIVDADDWVDSKALAELVSQLKNQTADLFLMSYRTVNMNTGEEILQSSAPEEWKSGDIHLSFCEETCPVPQLHGTVFRVDFLRKAGINLLEDAYYVDEQLMVWSYMSAESACKLELDVYRYSVGSRTQSISFYSMAEHWYDRERVIRSCLERQYILMEGNLLQHPCPKQLAKNIGNHFTTLYIYLSPREKGNKIAKEWRSYIQKNVPYLWNLVKQKAWILSLLCFAHISPLWYERMKCTVTLKKILRHCNN